MRYILCLFSLLCAMSLTQCMSYDFARRPVQQGNLLPKEKIDRLKVGMTKNDVAILMGTSLISPTFNNDRWDYAYTWRRGNGPLTIQHVTLSFSHDRLKHIERSL